MRKRVLIIDDEIDVVDLLRHSLQKEFLVVTAADGPTGLKMSREKMPDAIILDLLLPGMSGFQLCREIQTEPSTRHIPIIVLTAKADEVDRVVSFELGADDYVTKPFSPRELLLRVKAILRRRESHRPQKEIFRLGGLVVDRSKHTVTRNGREVPLTAIEFRLLTALLERTEKLLSREWLLLEVWGDDSAVDVRTVDTHVSRLREKLGDSGKRIQTVRGFGYRLSEQD